MNIPTIPFDSIAKFLLFIGLFLILSAVYFTFNQTNTRHIMIRQNADKQVELKYQYKLDSAEVNWVKKKITLSNIEIKKVDISIEQKSQLLKELYNDSISLFKKNMLKEETSKKLKLLKLDMTSLDDKGEFFFILLAVICGGFFLAIGLHTWDKSEQLNNAGLQRKVLIETKELPCQSCGMILKYDLKSFVEAGFCSTCFDGEKFVETELTFKEMQKRIEKRMKEQGISEKAIKKHITGLIKLNRWSQVLKW